MKVSYLIFSLFCLSTINSIGQTKLISHKSHSGSNKTLRLSLEKNLFNIGASNFGGAPQRFVRNSNLDTVKLLSPNVAVMITSETCHYEDYNPNPRDISATSLWSAGSDTVFYHDVFNAKNSLEKIKSTLKQEYFFSNSIDSVVFIGFDGDYAVVEPKRAEPIKHEPLLEKSNKEDSNDHKRPSYFMIILIALFSTWFRTPF